jgi:hypothetical protein
MSAAAGGPPVVSCENTPAKGRTLVTTRDVKAGEVVLEELPILLSLYDDAKELACARCLAPLAAASAAAAVGCPSCRQVAFCSPACAAAASQEPWVHAPATCQAYAQGLAMLPEVAGGGGGDASAASAANAATEARSSLRFLIQALALRALAHQYQQQQQQQAPSSAAAAITENGAERYARLLSLCTAAGPQAETTAAASARALLPALAAAVGGPAALPAEDEVAALLSREQANSFAVQAPSIAEVSGGGGRVTRSAASSRRRPRPRLLGGALYCRASLVNHECLPNVARFDDFAAAGSSSEATPPQAGRLRLVALHPLPKGTELALCYVPLRWPRAARRAHCQSVYGFSCACARCALEARADVFAAARGEEEDEEEGQEGASEWETDEDEGDWEEEEEGQEAEDTGMDEAADATAAAAAGAAGPAAAGDGVGKNKEQEDAMDPTYLHLFLLKYACGRRGCSGGTMAPLLPASDAAVLVCNACGGRRTEAEFLAELTSGGGGGR